VNAIFIDYLNGPDVQALARTDDEILGAVQSALLAQRRGKTVIEPRTGMPVALLDATSLWARRCS
jgi:ornithine cyclodeaminase